MYKTKVSHLLTIKVYCFRFTGVLNIKPVNEVVLFICFWFTEGENFVYITNINNVGINSLYNKISIWNNY